jgi:phosphoglycolate phosphatase-like HAD superfamily hydrolase
MSGSVERPLAVVDIDGVVADVGHRLHHIARRPKDWDAFFAAAPDDPPHPEGLAVVARLEADHEIVYLTGRPERCRADTEAWLNAHGLGGRPLHMRPAGTFEPAAEVKLARLRQLAAAREVAVVVDDDPAVLAAVAAAGFPTFAAGWADRTPALHRAQEVEGRT